jgi:uncharacterized protein YutE (UPF0331/DUF86 family)
LANHTIRTQRLGIPKTTTETFGLLARNKIISDELAERLTKMTGFRNTIIHQYQKADLAIVRSVIVSGLNDLIKFGDRINAYLENQLG